MDRSRHPKLDWARVKLDANSLPQRDLGVHFRVIRKFSIGALCGPLFPADRRTRLAGLVTCDACRERLERMAPDHLQALVQQRVEYLGARARQKGEVRLDG